MLKDNPKEKAMKKEETKIKPKLKEETIISSKLKEEKLKAKCEKNRERKIYHAKLRMIDRRYRAAISEIAPASVKAEPPKRSLTEEILNSVTHGAGAVFTLVAFPLMLMKAASGLQIIGISIYFVGMLLSFLSSTLYHAFRHGSAVKRLFRRFDYSSIYLLIGATFILPLLTVFDGVFRGIFIVVQWLAIAFGITLVAIFGPSRFRFIHIPLYVILGWSALMLLPGLVAYSAPLATFILLGGVSYTLGIIPFAIKIPYSHPLWHVFVLVGALLQWIGIYSYLL